MHDAIELHGRHTGKEIWIAGSDPSLSEYPDDFFKDKISISLHLAHQKFPDATYRYSSEYDRSTHLKEVDPLYKQGPLIAALPMYGKTVAETKALVSDFREVYFHRMVNYPPTGIRGEVDEAFTDWKVRQTLAGKARIWGGHGTCLHTAFYMAILLGAKSVHLIGAGHGLYHPELEHFAEVEGTHHEMRPGYRSFSGRACPALRADSCARQRLQEVRDRLLLAPYLVPRDGRLHDGGPRLARRGKGAGPAHLRSRTAHLLGFGQAACQQDRELVLVNLLCTH